MSGDQYGAWATVLLGGRGRTGCYGADRTRGGRNITHRAFTSLQKESSADSSRQPRSPRLALLSCSAASSDRCFACTWLRYSGGMLYAYRWMGQADP